MPETPPPAALPLDEIAAARDEYERVESQSPGSYDAFRAWGNYKQLLWENRDALLAEIARLRAEVERLTAERDKDREKCRRGGLKGGPARASKLTDRRRSEIARHAARERWRKARARRASS